jgi:hypothetical protein
VPSFEREFLGTPTEANRPQDRTHIERCLAAGGLIEPNPVFSNYHYILQTPDYVVIVMTTCVPWCAKECARVLSG